MDVPFVLIRASSPLARVYGRVQVMNTHLITPMPMTSSYLIIALPADAIIQPRPFMWLWRLLNDRPVIITPAMMTEEKIMIYRLMMMFGVRDDIITIWANSITEADYHANPVAITQLLSSISLSLLNSRVIALITEPDVVEEETPTIISHLEKLVQYYIILGDRYRVNTFSLALKVIANRGDLRATRGIAGSTLDEIAEFQRRGTTSRLMELERQPRIIALSTAAGGEEEKILALFRTVYGIGRVAARRLYDEGYRTLADLSRAPLTEAQMQGLQWYYHLQQRVPRAEVDEWRRTLAPIFASFGNYWTIVGSYRRGEPSSGDIDIAMRNDRGYTLPMIVGKMVAMGLVVATLALGDKKFMGIGLLAPGRTARRIDIRLFDPSTWAYALLYNTGSQALNIMMRNIALSLGLTMNEYGLVSIDGRASYPASTEEEIFRHLGMVHLPPEERGKAYIEQRKQLNQ